MKEIQMILTHYKQALHKGLGSIDEHTLEEVVRLLWEAYQKDKHIFICGNGGSAATSSHLVCDLAKATTQKNKKRLKVISLTDNVPLITAWSNDTDYRNCFQEQLVNLLEEGDVLIGISVSGNSENVLNAVRYAKSKGASTVGLAGFGGGKLGKIADVSIIINSDDYGVVEDIQLSIGHIIKDILIEFISKINE